MANATPVIDRTIVRTGSAPGREENILRSLSVSAVCQCVPEFVGKGTTPDISGAAHKNIRIFAKISSK